MSMNWTEEQKKVINSRNRNLLVSAAAGSGKTAVLVEHVVQMITDASHPVDIDRLLIVTFTNAAAEEMRERILGAVEKKLEEHPTDRHLRRQMTYIHHAGIMTIDKFCYQIVRENFEAVDMDPAFRIGEKGELELMKQDALEEVLEKYYEEGGEEFYDFVENYVAGKKDDILGDLILQVYESAQSHLNPGKWIEECRGEAEKEKESREAILSSPWMEKILFYVHQVIEGVHSQALHALSVAQSEEGPASYIPALESDLLLLEKLLHCESFEDFREEFSELVFAPLKAASKKDTVSPGKKNEVMSLRNGLKDQLKSLKKDFFQKDIDQVQEELALGSSSLDMLFRLSDEFSRTYREKKREKNLADFSDLEHMALKILSRESDGGLVPSERAKSLAQSYEEIMIDEYQDSNELQDQILKCISREWNGTPNTFMVGDVKQSIYSFRLARPELFMEKYEQYSRTDSLYQKITLGKNFRSRPEVLSDVNFLFEQIMRRELGNISYEEDHFLYPGAFYPPMPDGQTASTEIYVIDEKPGNSEHAAANARTEGKEESAADGKYAGGREESAANGKHAGGKEESAADGKHVGSKEESAADGEEEKNRAWKEGVLIAQRIRRMMQEGVQVFDQKTGTYRDLKLGDIVILLRTMKGWSEDISESLLSFGIPAYCETSTGYFDTLEVRTVLHLLSALDNPEDDISLAAVLKSPIGGFSSEELAQIRIRADSFRYYDCCMDILAEPCGAEPEADFAGEKPCGAEPEDDPLRARLTEFFRKFETWRDKSVFLPLYQLIDELLEETGYRYYVAAMPGGKRRLANLEMLMEKAAAYEETSYRGLFRFVRYIEKLKEYEVDFGEASQGGEAGNTVRIMSVHKSKGLEFPVVFVAGLGKEFNFRDSRGTILTHPDLGVGCDSIDPVRRLKYRTLKKKAIGNQLALETVAEELRVFYVAVTRAKEKLILVGSDRDFDKTFAGYAYLGGHGETKLPFGALCRGTRLLDFVVMSLIRCSCMQEVYRESGIESPSFHPLYLRKTNFEFHLVDQAGLSGILIRDAVNRKEKERIFQMWQAEQTEAEEPVDGEMKDILDAFRYQYPYEEATHMVSHQSVSDVKHRYMDLLPQEAPEQAAPDFGIRDLSGQAALGFGIRDLSGQIAPSFGAGDLSEQAAPGFRNLAGKASGTQRGTAYHKVLQLWDYRTPSSIQGVSDALDAMVKEGKLREDDAALIYPGKILGFLCSPLGERIKHAYLEDSLVREATFVMGVPAKEINLSRESEETILIQGMIDAYFEEDGEYVLVDYKTDVIKTPEELVKRYRIQMELYQRALSEGMDCRVKAVYLYSFALEREIEVHL